MTEPLPPFAKEWMAQWRFAAQELPKIRARELRAMTDERAVGALELLDLNSTDADERSNGLVIQQAWFMRLRILQLQAVAK